MNFIIVWNLIAFALMGIDKHQSTNRGWRISERALISSAFLFGGVGIFLGMFVFHHKTKHWNFRFLVPFGIMVNVLLYVIAK